MKGTTMDTKSLFKSKTVWGALIAGASPALPMAVAVLGWDRFVSAEEITSLAQNAMALGGGALAIYGRVKARKVIK
jgi:hypothetical protein